MADTLEEKREAAETSGTRRRAISRGGGEEEDEGETETASTERSLQRQ